MALYFAKSGGGPAVILLHGLFGSGDNLGLLARYLEDRFTVYSVDLPNHGQSPALDPVTYPLMAREVVALLDRENIGSAHLVGHSMGGKVAMQIALDFPHRVSRLVAADIAPVAYPPHHSTIIAALADLDLAKVSSRGDASAKLADDIPEPDVRAFLVRSLERTETGFRWRIDIKAISNSYKHIMAGLDGSPFEGPTLFIKGGRSDYMIEAYREKTIRLFPNSTLTLIKGAGHWLHAEQPDEFNRSVAEFLLG